MGTQVSGTSVASDAPATSEATPTATVDAIASTLISEKPAVSEHAIAAAQVEAAAQQGKDSQGNSFNAAIHATNADGSPRKTITGRFALKRGKKSGAAPSATSQPATSIKGVVVPGASAQQSAKEQAARQGGAGAANLMLMCAVGLGGDEWQPRRDEKSCMDEKLMLETAFGDWFAAHEWQDLPPGLALVAAIGIYAMPRFQMPKTQTRMQKFKGWLGAKIGKWKATRIAKKRGVPESDVERADRESREHYAREKQPVEVGAR